MANEWFSLEGKESKINLVGKDVTFLKAGEGFF
jgi:hypothetical protein